MTASEYFDDALEELITGVDDQGEPYPIGKLDAHRASIRHRAVSIFLFRGDQLLLQQRAGVKYHAPLQWANSACSHPRWGEDSKACAKRTLRRELSLETPLRLAGSIAYDAPIGTLFENEVVDCFRGDLAPDIELDNLGSPEVANLKLVSVAVLNEAIRTRCQDFAPWFRIYVDRGLVHEILAA
ncbi:NUDIX hydrolase [Pelagibacterium luteolum]|uniref:isopentenyl-diphosphate Delta-isomerase n=1 Tax=Pelagibacterium luteolum TaxID=440168 RepID=A0A1G7SUM4_9HYPH|nr:NUDIX domain-containing protein [Pelagibacterium luteolum]SDG26767.1 isopentenyl-diphosphate delta-isomerase [Pelagibacterium luteolum]